MTRRSSIPISRRLLTIEKRLNNTGHRFIAGVDEAGRGPLAGPVVAGAVILKAFDFSCEINDSKQLSHKKREAAYSEILSRAFVGVGIVDERTIDSINIYQATLKAMQLAVASLEIEPDCVIVDGRMKLAADCPVKCFIKGDCKSLSIAAASIVAKVTRDRLMLQYDKMYPDYGFSSHKGYGTRLHKERLARFGPSPIHRLSFRPLIQASPDKP